MPQQAAQDQLVPLMSEAAFKGDVATMERLVSKGASVNQHDQVSVLSRVSMCGGVPRASCQPQCSGVSDQCEVSPW